jgi:hypothetical protein
MDHVYRMPVLPLPDLLPAVRKRLKQAATRPTATKAIGADKPSSQLSCEIDALNSRITLVTQ